MFDMHYDLLSVLYRCYLSNDYSYLNKLNEVFREDNISGMIANLDVVAIDRCAKDYDVKNINIVEIFRLTTELAKKYYPNLEKVYSIEGADYINFNEELEQLVNLGLESILITHNAMNKYGSGKNSDFGLTKSGIELITKAVELGLMIDVSHMNKATLDDTVSLLKSLKAQGLNTKVIASHSNVYELCEVKRNLSIDQLINLKELDPLIGVVSYSEFINYDEFADKETMNSMYLKHIDTMVEIFGIDNVTLSSDDMDYGEKLFGVEQGPEVFEYKSINKEIRKILSTKYNEEDIDKLMNKNIISRIGDYKNDRYSENKRK